MPLYIQPVYMLICEHCKKHAVLDRLSPADCDKHIVSVIVRDMERANWKLYSNNKTVCPDCNKKEGVR